METQIQSQSFVSFLVCAGIGGFVVVAGLLLEKLGDKKWYANLRDFRSSKRLKELGEWGVIIGVAIEVVVAVWFAAADWENKPMNRPITSISATARIFIDGDGNWRRPSNSDDWSSLVSFFSEKIEGSFLFERAAINNIGSTNRTPPKALFTLLAKGSDAQVVDVFGNRKIEYDITFSDTHLPEADIGYGKPARIFNDVRSLVLQVPQISSNAPTVSGSISVTINATLVWTFDIPPQIQRHGVITAEKCKGTNGTTETKIMPITIVEMESRNQVKNLYPFDGK